jgi:hypothetical protein
VRRPDRQVNAPDWIEEARGLKSSGLTYAQVAKRVGSSRSQVYYWLQIQPGERRRATRRCKGCGERFEAYDLRRAYCTRDCWQQHAPSPATDEATRDKISAAKTKHGRSTGQRQRQLEHAGCTLQAKGETRCRNCGDERWLQLHHAIPRSLWRDGVLQPLNCIPLCVTCHMGWHHRWVTIHRDVFTAEEWGCLLSANLMGMVVEAWLDDRYPPRPRDERAVG